VLRATAESGEGAITYESTVRQGVLEYPDIDMVGEMSNLISAQRGFQLAAKMITTADEIEQMANTLRG
jgi:flagellar basal body rod protein FlgG